ncbi:MAG: hypothetical protein J7K26_03965 [Candidatus Aenigmarchaeota archaeon]|nr:hypothetical protein [Candidatus Aenigmarchaeota archaeon]
MSDENNGSVEPLFFRVWNNQNGPRPHFRPAFYKYVPEIEERIRRMLEK